MMTTFSFLVAALVLGVDAGQPMPFLTPPDATECLLEPLQLELTEVIGLGRIQDQVAKNHCLRHLQADMRHPNTMLPRVVGKTRLGKFRLFGEQLGFGFNVVMVPGTLGSPDFLYTTPAIDLPEEWLKVRDMATYPVLAVGGALMMTTVIMKLLK